MTDSSLAFLGLLLMVVGVFLIVTGIRGRGAAIQAALK